MTPIPPPPRPPPPPVPPSRVAILLSTFVYPGVGQCVQRRWLAAAFWLLTTSAALVWFVAEIVRVLSAFYGLAFSNTEPTAAPGWHGVLASLVVTLVFYIGSILDTVAAHNRALRRRRAD